MFRRYAAAPPPPQVIIALSLLLLFPSFFSMAATVPGLPGTDLILVPRPSLARASRPRSNKPVRSFVPFQAPVPVSNHT